MGLDSVELVMEAEDEFGIVLPDREAEKIRTVRDFVDSVERQLHLLAKSDCPIAILFYRLRRAWSEEPALAGVRLRPRTALSEFSCGFSGWWARRRLWALAQHEGVTLPQLAMPFGLDRCLIGAFVASIIGGVGWAAYTHTPWPLLVMGAAILALFVLTSALARKIPLGVSTVADALRASTQIRASKASQLPRAELEKRIIHLVGGQLAISTSDIGLDSRFIEDLHID